MTLNLLDAIGNWNPQLFRELKGRLKIGNVAIASALSICGQLLLFMFLYAQPNVGTLEAQNFWLKLFVDLSIFSAIVLLVAGTYMLVSDLDKEERRGTLNFIRLSPQSATAIFTGKILGVPILLYLAGILAVPLHLYSGLKTQIPLQDILCLYGAIAASCAFFYSAAMLFGLTTSWLGGFQPWLAGAAVLFFITVAFNMPSTTTAIDLAMFLSPAGVLKFSAARFIDRRYSDLHWLVGNFQKLQWFGLPIGTNIALCTALTISICALGTYWMWQGWQRRFPNPSATVLSKRQSYLLTICGQSIILGFALQSNIAEFSNLACLSIVNLGLFLGLIAALTPERQALYDWARYRKQIVPSSQKLWRRYPILDLIWSEKSPAQVAIAINLLIATQILTFWMLEVKTFFFALLMVNFIMIYAAIAQLFLFTKIRNQAIWAVCTIGGAIILPPIILSLLSLHFEKAPLIWMFSVFPVFGSWSSLSSISATTVFLPVLGQWTVLVLLNLKLTRQLRIAGESASKALLKA